MCGGPVSVGPCKALLRLLQLPACCRWHHLPHLANCCWPRPRRQQMQRPGQQLCLQSANSRMGAGGMGLRQGVVGVWEMWNFCADSRVPVLCVSVACHRTVLRTGFLHCQDNHAEKKDCRPFCLPADLWLSCSSLRPRMKSSSSACTDPAITQMGSGKMTSCSLRTMLQTMV